MLNKIAAAALFALIAAPGFAAPVDGPGPNVVLEIAGADGAAKGKVVIDLTDDLAPDHAARIVDLTKSGAYDGVIFHRVIDGFMAQTGDVQYGKKDGNTAMAGTGGSDQPDLKAEFSKRSFDRGIVGMARSADPDSANSQFFIMFAPAPHLDGQYTVVGHVVEGMDVVDTIAKGDTAANGSVDTPDYIAKATVAE